MGETEGGGVEFALDAGRATAAGLDSAPPFEGAAGFEVAERGQVVEWSFPAGTLAGAEYLAADFLHEGTHLAAFELKLRDEGSGRSFLLHFALLNECQARMRLPLAALDQSRWQLGREGAFLKPSCYGDAVDPARVTSMALGVIRQSELPVRLWMTPVRAAPGEPPRLERPALPKGALLDALGQSAIHDWPGKTRSAGELVDRVRRELARADEAAPPPGRTVWGGSADIRFEATGFFRTERDGGRWWLVAPDGSAFWSAGLDCVDMNVQAAVAGLEDAVAWLPPREGGFASTHEDRRGRSGLVNSLRANWIRAVGPGRADDSWWRATLARLRGWGFNTVGNWSDWRRAGASRFPHVRPLAPAWKAAKCVFRDFPDVFDERAFAGDARTLAGQLEETRDAPALVGYFLMNEPTWGFARQLPAEGMLRVGGDSQTRRALARFLRGRHGPDDGLARAWRMEVAPDEMAGPAPFRKAFTTEALRDLADFSGVMADRLFGGLSKACREVDPVHLNLGARYHTLPPDWCAPAMTHFDVYSQNCYERTIPGDELARLCERIGRPVMIGEFHFGALDAGLPGPGICRVRDQEERGLAYRHYLEDACAKPHCVGVHYFTLYDESALGRFDGENWNIGFVDVCERPYGPVVECARLSHERIYRVHAGREPPFAGGPGHMPRLFT